MKQNIFRFIADLRFSILMLLLLSLVSMTGTVIEQDQSIETYKLNYSLTHPVFGFLTWDLIIRLGLDHVYQTWWFFVCLSLFGLSLIFCTILQQLPSLRIARRCQFFRNTQQFYRLKLSTLLHNLSFPKLLGRMKEQHYSIFQQKNIVYGYKGISGRLAPILVHLSILLILLGTIIGSLFGFQAQEIVPKTENFHTQNFLKNGTFTSLPMVSARINDFWITYNQQKTISQFYSDLSILNQEGNEIDRKTLSVNDPFIYQNVYYYQTDWNLIGLRFETVSKETFQYPLVNLGSPSQKLWLSWINPFPSISPGMVVMVDNLEGYSSLYNQNGKFLGNLELHERIPLEETLLFSEILSSTGLQMKEDIGLPMIYSGFLFLMISTLLSYITYSQIWLIKHHHQIFIGGTTNRATFQFELDFFQLLTETVTER